MSEWTVKKLARTLRAGDRFVFDPDLGGEGEALTVESAANYFGTTEVATEEFDFTIDIRSEHMVTMAPPEKEEQ